MTKKSIAIFFAVVCTGFCAFGQMTDDALLNYVIQGVNSGKSKQQLTTELLAKGVTASQAKRVMQSYSGKQFDGTEYSSVKTNTLDVSSREIRERSAVSATIEDKKDFRMEEQDTVKTVVLKDEEKKVVIYGHDIFGKNKLSFEPNVNMATPRDYVLGPGDEVIIDVWGVNEASIRQKISPEGRIIISQSGPVMLAGLTIDQAEKKLRKVLSAKYSLNGPDAASQMSLTLGNIRSILVHVMGEVKMPGTYRLSSLSSVFNALHFAGGITDIGSVRNIAVSRNGEVISTVDLYSMIFDGRKVGNVSLKDEDIIIVPPYLALVETDGGFKRPMYYEVLPGDKVSDIVKFTGGFLSAAYDKEVMVQHRNGTKGDVHSVSRDNFANVEVRDGDIITAYVNEQRTLYANMVQVKGCVSRPGTYELGGGIATLRQLVERAGGPLEEAFLTRAQLVREQPDRQLEIKAVPLGAILEGKAEDIILRPNDVLIVSDELKLDPKGDLRIEGYVREPGNYEYADGITVQDLILLAGGLEDGASLAKVDVSRRIIDNVSTESADTLAKVFTFSMENGLVVEGDADFTLLPYDIVSVRKSPSYIEQRCVRISGEATFPGEYTLVTNEERISTLFKRAGGPTVNAYIGGAMLKRKVTEDERNVRRNMMNLVKRGGNKRDSTMVNKLNINETYSIGINLQNAIDSPGSADDIILHDGDELIIPSLTNTVRIQGEVLYPNAVNYIPGKGVDYYIRQAGGYSNEAKRSKVYVVHMNGKVSVGLGARICAGDEIIVPIRPERQKTTVGEWVGIGSAAASVTTMIATIVSLMKR
ncbi:MAG: SLBB domain-containing protein [Bacteroidales bacterium]|nr:SLBB domain-containing protein [Bacteroidales bacterium]